MNGGFVKLYGSILDSSVWSESMPTRIVWITLLVMADRDGVIESSIPGLARRAGVSLEDCEAALTTLRSPDPYSRTKDDDGRRLRECDGGWLVLNHARYRERQTPDAARKRRERANNDPGQCPDVRPRSQIADPAGRGVVVDLSVSSSIVADVTPVAGSETAGAREPTPAAEPPPPTPARAAEEAPSSHAVALREPARTLAPTRAGRVYRGRHASSGEIDALDWWRREVLAALPPAQRCRVPGFTADVAELGPGLARALDQHGELLVRQVVGWATTECAAGRISPKHYRALFNGDSFELRVVEAAAHVAGEAADQHTVSPELAAAIAKARKSVEHNRGLLECDDERRLDDDIRAMVEVDLREAEERLAELLGDSRRGASAHGR